jgi:opacity protein-like surface antigen
LEVFVKSKMVMSAVFSAVMAVAATTPALAQTNDVQPTPSFTIHGSFLPEASGATLTTDQAGAAPKTHQMGDRSVFLRLQGGLITGVGDTGFLVGLAAGDNLKQAKNVEIGGDFSFGRIAGENDLYISFNGLYDVHLKGHQVMPYLGGGIGINHVPNFTQTGLQLIAGIQLPVTGPHVVRFEVRFLLVDGSPVLLLGSFSF